MLKKVLGVMLSVMVIGGIGNNTGTMVSVDKQQGIEVAELGSGDVNPYSFKEETNKEA